jgi:hypothetical protein
MTAQSPSTAPPGVDREVIDWLLAGDPAIRWQVLRDLLDASPEQYAAERALIADEGWGAQLLALQREDGTWAGGACFPAMPPPSADAPVETTADGVPLDYEGQPWISTLPTLDLLRDFGIDPADARVRAAMEAVRDGCVWEYDRSMRFFDGEVEACINGRTLASGAYFGVPVDGIASRLVGEVLPDGGWNCEAENGSVRSSFHTTIDVLDGLLAYEKAGLGTADTEAARSSGEEYLLTRGLFRSKITGQVIDESWLEFAYPPRWYYDVLRGLDYFRATGAAPDPRVAEAVEIVRRKRLPDGTWALENTHPGDVHFALEVGDGAPSRWNTLRALRVLRWYDAA